MRRPVIGVVGGGYNSVPPGSSAYVTAQVLGRLIAEAGAILLCGGGGGIMEAVAVSAKAAGGHTVGIMPSQTAPNAGIEFAIFTGMGDGRNFLNAAVSDVVIAMQGEAGTLSEIALAIKSGTPVVYLSAWDFLSANGLPKMPYVTNPRAAIAEAFGALGIQLGEKLSTPLKLPPVPDEGKNLAALANVVAQW